MTATQGLRWAARAEGISLLLLLGVAMPLEYLAGLPSAVRVAGGAHGLCFVWLCAALFRAHLETGLRAGEALRLLLAAALPFGFLSTELALRRRGAGLPEADS